MDIPREELLAGYKKLYTEIEEMREKVEELSRVAKVSIKGYATLLWLHHGCERMYLYGDDGERQCTKCQIDFLRDKPQEIEKILNRRRA